MEELVGLLENPPPGSTFAGYDPFYIPMSVPANAPTPDFVFYIYDHLGNTRVTYSAAVECDASVAYTLEAVMDYYPYGKILRAYSNGEQEKYLTTQHERDVETGLDYRGARFYDADLGRFLSLDPLAADFAEWSAYNYVLGNPIIFIDPDGRNPIRVALKAMKALKKANKAWKKGEKFDGQKFLKEEGMDIVDGLATVIDPSASYIEKTLAIGELVSGLDLRTNKGQRAKKLWDKTQERLDKEFEVQDFGNKTTPLEKANDVAKTGGKFLDKKELAKRLGTTTDDYHDRIKPLMKKDFSKEMKKIGSTNPDFSPNDLGNVMLKHPKTGKTVHTNVPFDIYKKN